MKKSNTIRVVSNDFILWYHLTELGRNKYLERSKELQVIGLNLDESVVISDITEQDFMKLNAYQSEMLGCFCLLKQQATRETFPQGVPYIHFKPAGTAYIKPHIKKRVLSFATPDMLMRWHSRAADWCIDHEDGISERLHHLNHAHRDREAIRLIKVMRYSMMDEPVPEDADTLFDISLRHDDAELLSITARILICLEDYSRASKIISRISDFDETLGGILSAEKLLKQHKLEEAKLMIEAYDDGRSESLMISGICLLWSEMAKEAKEKFMETRIRMTDEGCIFNMDLLLTYEAFADMMLGNNDSARMMMEMATVVCINEKRKADLTEMAGRLFPVFGSEDCVLLERIDIRDVKVPDVLYVPLEHGKSLETESPCEDGRLDSEGCEDLWSEHSCSSELHPLSVEEDLDLQ